MNKYAYPTYAFREQKRYLRRHLIKSRSMKLHTLISTLQELNIFLGEFSPDTPRQETGPLPTDEIMDIIYHCIPTTRQNKIIEKGSTTGTLLSKE